MDLLLYLIKKNELDVYDIPIALIVEQYNAYLDLMQALNLDMVGDFLVMAATLSHVKSRMLLPSVEGEDEEEGGEDPRAELVRKILEYQRYKEAAEDLIARPLLGRDVYTRETDQSAIHGAAQEAGIPEVTFIEVGVFGLLEAFKEVMEKAQITNWHEVAMERVSIMDRINQVLDLFKDVDTLGFEQLFTEVTDRFMVIATFLAILELVKLKVIKVHQETRFGAIVLVRAVTIDDEWLTENLPGLDTERG